MRTLIAYAAAVESTAASEAPAKAKKAKAAPKPAQELVTVNSKALSTDVGPMVIAGMAKTYDDEEKAHSLIEGVKSKRYDLMAATTQAIVKAAKADESIALTAAFSGDAKQMNKLNDQLGLALGFREVHEAGGKKRLIYAKAVSKFFPTPKDQKGAPLTKRKATLRSNFLHMLKKCVQASVAIIEREIDIKTDKDSGTLLISGPAVKKQFGADEVLLNEKQTVDAGGGNSVQLTEKPSFTALAAAAAVDHGASVQRGNTSRSAQVVTNPDDAIEAIAKNVIAALGKIKGAPTARQKVAIASIQSACAKVMKG